MALTTSNLGRHCQQLFFWLILSLPPLVINAYGEPDSIPWTISCQGIDEQKGRDCIMYQEIILKDGGHPVMQFSIGVTRHRKDPIVLITLPLGIYLPNGVALMIDGQDKVNFPIERCEPDGCHVLVSITDKRIERLKSGNDLQISFYDREKIPLTISLSLRGFEAAFNKIN